MCEATLINLEVGTAPGCMPPSPPCILPGVKAAADCGENSPPAPMLMPKRHPIDSAKFLKSDLGVCWCCCCCWCWCSCCCCCWSALRTGVNRPHPLPLLLLLLLAPRRVRFGDVTPPDASSVFDMATVKVSTLRPQCTVSAVMTKESGQAQRDE